MPTVLLIDDDNSILLLVSAFLGQAGYRVLTADNGRTGLELFAAAHPDVVVCDLSMPILDGLGVLAELRKTSPLTPFVVFSGTSDVSLAVQALREGAWDFLLKPLPDLALLPPVLERMQERALLLKEKEEAQARLEEQVRIRTSQLVRQLREKDLLLAEVHHRVKNNLQIILVLLGLQRDHAREGSVQAAIQASCDRIHTLAMVQEEMHDSEHAILVDALGYVTGMVHHLLSAHGLTPWVDLNLDVESLSLSPGLAFTCGLVLNELMAGLAHELPTGPWSLGVGFRAIAPGTVELALTETRGRWASWMAQTDEASLGQDLVAALASGPKGALVWDPHVPERITVRMT